MVFAALQRRATFSVNAGVLPRPAPTSAARSATGHHYRSRRQCCAADRIADQTNTAGAACPRVSSYSEKQFSDRLRDQQEWEYFIEFLSGDDGWSGV